VAVLGNRLFISDSGNNRVLLYTGLPSSDFAPADVVLGQPDMTSGAANNGGVSAASLDYVCGVYPYGAMLWIADAYNARVLHYDDPTTTCTVTPTVTPTATCTVTPTVTAAITWAPTTTVTPPALASATAPELTIRNRMVHLGRGERLQLVVQPQLPGRVTVTVFDLTGRKIAVLLDAFLPAEPRDLSWDGAGVGSGVYIVRLDSHTQNTRCKILLVR